MGAQSIVCGSGLYSQSIASGSGVYSRSMASGLGMLAPSSSSRSLSVIDEHEAQRVEEGTSNQARKATPRKKGAAKARAVTRMMKEAPMIKARKVEAKIPAQMPPNSRKTPTMKKVEEMK